MRGRRVLVVCALGVLLLLVGCQSEAASPAADEPAAAVQVPNVVGLTESGARSVVEREGFTVGEVTSEEVPETGAATVLRQTPAAGVTAAAGDTVDLVVSIPAVAMVKVPDVSKSGTKT